MNRRGGYRVWGVGLGKWLDVHDHEHDKYDGVAWAPG